MLTAVAIDRLAKIVEQYDLTEVEISLGDLRVRLARQRSPSAQADHGGPRSGACYPQFRARRPPFRRLGSRRPWISRDAVKSPMVGTAYLRSSPEAKPFVEVGSVVKVGDKLLLIEAMKTFNDIVASRAGKVVSILVVDGAPVEYDQPLMIIE